MIEFNKMVIENVSKKDIKKDRLEQALRRQRMKKIFWSVAAVVFVIAAVFGIVGYNNWKNKNLPGQFFADQGREHVGLGHPHTYNSNPPTSGPHYTKEADWGVYKEELPDETLVHNLEHGGIWISYKPDISEEIRKKLESFYDKYGRKIIVAPRSRNDSDIALAAWTRLDKFGAADYSDERVEKFIKAFRNKGPEYVP